MSSFTATTSPLAGLGLSFDAVSINSSFSSGEESFNSLFSGLSRSPSVTDGSEPSSPDDTRGHWHVVYASDWESELEPAEPDFNYFEPYRGVPEVTDFMPWPTSPELATAALAVEAHSMPPTPNDRGYETDTDSPRVRRRHQRRRDPHKRRQGGVHYLVEHVEPIIEEPPSLEEAADRMVAHTPESSSSDLTAAGLGLGLPAMDEAERILKVEDGATAEGFDADIEQEDVTDVDAEVGPEPTNQEAGLDSQYVINWESDSSDWEKDEDYDSDDSDVDRYFDLSHVDEYDYDPNDRRVHYLVQHVRPIIEDLPSLEELQARGMVAEPVHHTPSATEPKSQASTISESHTMSGTNNAVPTGDPTLPPAPAHIGLGIALGLVPTPLPPLPEGFETIDLTDSTPAPASVPHPDSPELRPYTAMESPSPIMLASPMRFAAAFRRFDDLTHFEADGQPEYATRAAMEEIV